MSAEKQQLEQGVIVEVSEVTLGNEFAVDVAAGVLAVSLDDAVDFNEDGGTLIIDDAELVDYVSANLDEDTIELATPLQASYLAGDSVKVYPEARERVALVRLDVDGEAIEARVPHALYDKIAEGVRGEDSESVSLVLDGDEWVIDDVLGQEPFVDGSYIDETTLPQPVLPPPTDLTPPAVSPTPEALGGIGVIFVRWAGIDNNDPVTYEVHISTVDGFFPDASTLAVETSATSTTIRQLPGVATDTFDPTLQYGVTYFVRIVAKDDDGPAPVSTQDSTQLVQINTADIAAYAVTADQILGRAIRGEHFAADVVLSSVLRTADVGARVEISNDGINVFDSTGEQAIALPSNIGPDTQAKFKGNVEADGLTVLGGMSLRSKNNEVATASSLTLATGVGNPRTQPTVGLGWASVPFDIAAANDFWGSRFAGDDIESASRTIDGKWIAHFYNDANNEMAAFHFNDDGSFAQLGSEDHFWTFATYQHVWKMTRISMSDVEFNIDPYGSTEYTLHRGNAGAGVRVAMLDPTKRPALGHDGTNVLVAEYDAPNDRFRLRTYRASDLALLSTKYTTPHADIAGHNTNASVVLKGTFDFGATRWVLAFRDPANDRSKFYVFDDSASPVLQPYETFDASSGSITGAGWNGTRFVSVGAGGNMRHHSNITWGVGTDVPEWEAGYTWADRDALGGYHETLVSPLTVFDMKPRAQITITAPELPPSSGGTDEPTSVGFYLRGKGDSNLRLQLYDASNVVTITDDVTMYAGTLPPTTNSFDDVGATPGSIETPDVLDSANRPKFKVDGTAGGNWQEIQPTGAVTMFAGAAAPQGWVLCDGQEVSRLTYKGLFDIIGTTYGAGNGTTTFNVPNFTDRMPVGANVNKPLGERGGSTFKNIGTSVLPPHVHSISHDHAAAISDGSHTHSMQRSNATGSSGDTYPKGTATVSNNTRTPGMVADGSHTHNIPSYSGNSGDGPGTGAPFDVTNPYQSLNFIIKT